MPIDRITVFCFAASYAVSLVLELFLLLRPNAVARWAALAFGLAGLLAHSLYLVVQRPTLASAFGSLLFLAWIVAFFCFFGALHHRHRAWGVVVLPLVLGLVVVAAALGRPGSAGDGLPAWVTFFGPGFWNQVHGALVLLAGVGVCVGFLASVMYLLQARRLRAKVPPGRGLQLLSLERLEKMNRRAINAAFPLLTAGVVVGVVLLVQKADQLAGWADPKIIGTGLLWLVFVVLLYLRYGFHARGRLLAVMTIVAFGLLVFTLASAHAVVQGGVP
jgi:ABC-type transport system involved in cytochrome c biogenesis permease subunit